MHADADSLTRTRAIFAQVIAEVLATDTLTPLRDAIVALVERENTPTLAAVAKLPGAAGSTALVVTGKNVTLWGAFSLDAVSAITELQIEGFVRLVPTVPLVYALEGIAPNLPLAQPGRSYTREHWLPTVLIAA